MTRVDHGERAVELLDGDSIAVRPIRPDDKERLAEGFRRLTERSRYSRFFTFTGSLSARQLAYFTEVDHHDHEALVATDTLTGDGIAVARFIRSTEDPRAAELAIAVVDSWQGRGVGTALLGLLMERAREEGIERFTGMVLADNRPMLELLGEFGETQILGREYGALEFSETLPRGTPGPRDTTEIREHAGRRR